MTPKEKAEELVVKFLALKIATIGCYDRSNPCVIENVMFKESAKQCALIAVEEIMRMPLKYGNYKNDRQHPQAYWDYWQEVKQEIEKL